MALLSMLNVYDIYKHTNALDQSAKSNIQTLYIAKKLGVHGTG